MVLSCEYDHFHACRFHGFAPLVGIQLFQIKDAGIFHAVSPLHAGKGIGTEMDESDEFIFKASICIGLGTICAAFSIMLSGVSVLSIAIVFWHGRVRSGRLFSAQAAKSMPTPKRLLYKKVLFIFCK